MLSSSSKFPLPILTPRLILRPPFSCHDDIHQYFNAITESMDELRPWMPWAKFYPNITQVEEYIETCNENWITKSDNNIGLPLWIINKETNKLVGNIVIWNIVWSIPKVEFGYWLRTSQTKQGYITEAVNALTRYCFLQLKVKRIEIKCEANNIRAKKVPERLGYRLEKVLHNEVKAISNNEPTDSLLFVRTDIKNLPELDAVWSKKK